MRRAELILPLALLAAPPALAQEAKHHVSVPAGRLDAAVFALGRQTASSIGIRDASLSGIRVKGLKGRHSIDGALAALLHGTGARARRVAAGAWLIERAPPPPPERARPAPAPAPADPVEGEDIVVTGTKRDVPLKAYPGGVQILDGDAIPIAAGGSGSEALTTSVASLASTHLGPGRNKLFIRGIADSSFVGPTQATVGQYWGNSRVTYSAPDPDLKLYDIGRVEVLEGPQGTLYGAGSLGGVVRVVPRAPDLWDKGGEVWGGGTLIQRGAPGFDVGGLVNYPLADGSLAVRALVYKTVDGGYIDDRERHLKDVNQVLTTGGRASLRWEVDGWTLDLNGMRQTITGKDAQYSDGTGDGLSRESAFPQGFGNQLTLGELVARKHWGDLELSTSVAYARQYVSEVFEGVSITAPDGSTGPVTEPGDTLPATDPLTTAYYQFDRVSMVTTETRLARRGPRGTGWLVGVSFLQNHGRVQRSLFVPLSFLRGFLTGVENTVDEATLYGEGTVEPVRGITLTAGGRLTNSHLTGDSQDANVFLAFRDNPHARAARTETRLLPSAAIAWRPNDAITLYGRYEQGFRPGGLAVAGDQIQRFSGDRLSTVEAGLRYGEENLEVSTTISKTWWSDIQADVIDGGGFPTTVNIGDGRVVTFGLSASWRPIPGLQLDGSIYVNGSKVFPIDGSPSYFNRLPNVADASGRFGAVYTTTLGGDARFSANGYARYVGFSSLGVGTVLGQLQGNYTDTGLELRLQKGARALTLSATNLLDRRANRFALGTPFLVAYRNQSTPQRPRSIRLGVEIGF